MSVIQLQSLIPMKTPLGDGYAIFLETDAHDYYWTIALDNGAIVTFTQDKLRICNSYTHGRGITDEKMKNIISK